MSKKYNFILSIDPSGSFHEGKGTTGWAILNTEDNRITKIGSIYAKNFKTKEEYWNEHLELIIKHKQKYAPAKLTVVMEDFILYSSKASSIINSKLETSKLIGIIEWFCHKKKIPITMQLASEVKNRWEDKILHHKKYLIFSKKKLVLPISKTPVDRHCKDAIRHAVHFHTFKNGGIE